MAFEFKLPDVGEGLHEAEILEWKVKEGDSIAEDEPLVEVQTDKASVELTSPVTGKVQKLNGKPGDVVAVGTVIAVILPEGAAEAGPPAAEPEAQPALGVRPAPAPAPAAAEAAPPEVEPAEPAEPGRRALATPATRRMARELGVDINQVRGTGPAGRVTPEDVQRHARGEAPPPAAEPDADAAPAAAEAGVPAPGAPAAPPAGPAPAAVAPAPARPAAPGPAPGQRVPLKGIRKRIAEAMVKSKHTAPHVTTVDEADLSELVAIRQRARGLAEQRGIKLTYLPFVIKALVAALKEFPVLNARLDDEAQEIIVHAEYNIGIATDTDNGLIVPVIKQADRKTIFQLAAEIAQLTEKARAGKLALDEIRGGTFSITNQGSVGGLFFTPIINWPEVAILGVSKIQERPVVRNGEIVVRQMAYMVLSFDHRVIDGALATRFLSRVTQYLSDPTLLFMEMV